NFPGFIANREKAMALLQEEANLNEIVRLVGADSLAPTEQLTLATAKMIREDFLQQNAFVDVDSYSETERQYLLLGMILDFDKLSREAL
ncbi:MAG: V-type ATP synthase subunit A, partial [Oscillospiraceae bacterium]|nr:V-type ATP synthase subunit A [Oscillospiraceae bacterium]